MSLQFLFVVMAIACYSISRLVTTDTIFAPARMWALGRVKAGGFWATLGTCNWCFSTWVAAVMVFVTDRWFQAIPNPVLWAIALRVCAGIVSDLLGLVEQAYHAAGARLDPLDVELRRAYVAAKLDVAVGEAAAMASSGSDDLDPLLRHATLERLEAEARKEAALADLAEMDLARRRPPPVAVIATQPCDRCGKELTRGLSFNGNVYCPECAASLGAVVPVGLPITRRAPAGRTTTIAPRDQAP